MKKVDTIEKYGEEAYARQLAQCRAWKEQNPDKVIDHSRTSTREHSRKGGKFYEKHRVYHKTGISGDRERVRQKHNRMWHPYKRIIAPGSQIHHEWIPRTAEYTGLALVEADKHMHGVIDVIKILDGEITLFTEEEIRNGGEYENILKR